MNKSLKNHLEKVLNHLYLSPLEKCNLNCKICYTKKTSNILSEKQILEFVERYQKFHVLQTITFCGGEVFTLTYFTALVNKLTEKGIFIQIITNGTVDKLNEFINPNFVNLIVSIDGLEKYHDSNRGQGNFKKSIQFLIKTKKLGFHTEIFSILTKENLREINKFEKYIKENIGNISITYHPRKSKEYLSNHPTSNITGETKNFGFLNKKEIKKIIKERQVFPPKNLGCYQISVMSDGQILGCCEGIIAIGNIEDKPENLFEKLKERIEAWSKTNTMIKCMGCSQPDFMCGLKEYYE